MKKKGCIVTAAVLLASIFAISGCNAGQNAPNIGTETTASPTESVSVTTEKTDEAAAETSAKEEVTTERTTEESKETEPVAGTPIDQIEDAVEKDVKDTLSSVNAKYEELTADIDTYDKFVSNTDRVESFYNGILEDTKAICVRMREYSIAYAEAVLSLDMSEYDKYDELEGLYDCIYDDAGDDIYDGIYDDLFDDLYDSFYDGIIDEAYDSIPYKEWSEVHSGEYERWSDTRSDIYDEWSDCRSDIYELWSDVGSELFDDDIERAYDKINDFKDDVAKLSGSVTASTSEKSEEAASQEMQTSAPAEKTEDTKTDELVDGMRPEFKEAMDSYEAFYDEYCAFLKKYMDDPSDLGLLAEYAEMMTKASEMDDKFEEWDEDEMNDAELKYYLEVQSRVMEQLTEAMQ